MLAYSGLVPPRDDIRRTPRAFPTDRVRINLQDNEDYVDDPTPMPYGRRRFLSVDTPLLSPESSGSS